VYVSILIKTLQLTFNIT